MVACIPALEQMYPCRHRRDLLLADQEKHVRDTTDRDSLTLTVPAHAWQRFTASLR